MIKSAKEALAPIVIEGRDNAKLTSNFLDLAILKYLGAHGKSYANHVKAGTDGVAESETTRSVGGRLKALETAGFVTKEINPKNQWIFWSITETGSKTLAVFEKRGHSVDLGAMNAHHDTVFAKKEKVKGEKKEKAVSTIDLSKFDEEDAPTEAPVGEEATA